MSVSREIKEWGAFRIAAKAWLVICSGALLLSLVRCTPAQSEAFRCKLAAAEELPDDPAQINLSDVVQVVEHLRACKAKSADAGR
jgi:hypothetical protein